MNLATRGAELSVPAKPTLSPQHRMFLISMIAVISIAAAWTALAAHATQAPGLVAPIEFDGPVYVEHRRGERDSSSRSTISLSDPVYVEFRQGERSGS